MLFNGWESWGRMLVVGALAYAGLIVLLRLSGKRTLAKMNAFDLVVTVALGSTLATVMTSKDVALAERSPPWRYWSCSSSLSPGCRFGRGRSNVLCAVT